MEPIAILLGIIPMTAAVDYFVHKRVTWHTYVVAGCIVFMLTQMAGA